MRYVDLHNQDSSIKRNTSAKSNRQSGATTKVVPAVRFELRSATAWVVTLLKFVVRHWKATVFLFLICLVGMGGWYGYTLLSSLNVKAQDLAGVPQAAVNFVTNQPPQVLNEKGRSNVLLLGIGGDGHEGPYLTDSMMLASIDIETGDAVLMSLPRDIWVPSTRSKINAVYAYSRDKDTDTALATTKKVVEDVLGIPVHYALRIDFNGFKRAIDLLDGVEVNVARAFVDPDYPLDGRERDMCGLTEVVEEVEITPSAPPAPDENGDGLPDKEMPAPTPYKEKQTRLKDAAGNDKTDSPKPFACRYETLRFEAGPTTMDGKTALKFVRSRHGTNGEGSDFARADRQQRVIESFKNEVLSAGTILNPARVTSLIQEFGKSIDTDIKISEYGEFIKIAQKSSNATIKTHTLTAEGKEAQLTVPLSKELYGGAYVLVPKDGNWETVHAQVQRWLSGEPEPTVTPVPSATPGGSVRPTVRPTIKP